ncbi:hypothetical protein BLNAU_14816 [Blattamonas nauphoetae]|uniref:Transmembrane protein n=1 Tax=Blattamonas nauphoetae TaxID=2049346 RepID=A0ABQ9XHX3_9EUKA|nr:hypothetical protein BLNAU_14816 [Blattamonas nauphoetae]
MIFNSGNLINFTYAIRRQGAVSRRTEWEQYQKILQENDLLDCNKLIDIPGPNDPESQFNMISYHFGHLDHPDVIIPRSNILSTSIPHMSNKPLGVEFFDVGCPSWRQNGGLGVTIVDNGLISFAEIYPSKGSSQERDQNKQTSPPETIFYSYEWIVPTNPPSSTQLTSREEWWKTIKSTHIRALCFSQNDRIDSVKVTYTIPSQIFNQKSEEEMKQRLHTLFPGSSPPKKNTSTITALLKPHSLVRAREPLYAPTQRNGSNSSAKNSQIQQLWTCEWNPYFFSTNASFHSQSPPPLKSADLKHFDGLHVFKFEICSTDLSGTQHCSTVKHTFSLNGLVSRVRSNRGIKTASSPVPLFMNLATILMGGIPLLPFVLSLFTTPVSNIFLWLMRRKVKKWERKYNLSAHDVEMTVEIFHHLFGEEQDDLDESWTNQPQKKHKTLAFPFREHQNLFVVDPTQLDLQSQPGRISPSLTQISDWSESTSLQHSTIVPLSFHSISSAVAPLLLASPTSFSAHLATYSADQRAVLIKQRLAFDTSLFSAFWNIVLSPSFTPASRRQRLFTALMMKDTEKLTATKHYFLRHCGLSQTSEEDNLLLEDFERGDNSLPTSFCCFCIRRETTLSLNANQPSICRPCLPLWECMRSSIVNDVSLVWRRICCVFGQEGYKLNCPFTWNKQRRFIPTTDHAIFGEEYSRRQIENARSKINETETSRLPTTTTYCNTQSMPNERNENQHNALVEFDNDDTDWIDELRQDVSSRFVHTENTDTHEGMNPTSRTGSLYETGSENGIELQVLNTGRVDQNMSPINVISHETSLPTVGRGQSLHLGSDPTEHDMVDEFITRDDDTFSCRRFCGGIPLFFARVFLLAVFPFTRHPPLVIVLIVVLIILFLQLPILVGTFNDSGIVSFAFAFGIVQQSTLSTNNRVPVFTAICLFFSFLIPFVYTFVFSPFPLSFPFANLPCLRRCYRVRSDDTDSLEPPSNRTVLRRLPDNFSSDSHQENEPCHEIVQAQRSTPYVMMDRENTEQSLNTITVPAAHVLSSSFHERFSPDDNQLAPTLPPPRAPDAMSLSVSQTDISPQSPSSLDLHNSSPTEFEHPLVRLSDTQSVFISDNRAGLCTPQPAIVNPLILHRNPRSDRVTVIQHPRPIITPTESQQSDIIYTHDGHGVVGESGQDAQRSLLFLPNESHSSEEADIIPSVESIIPPVSFQALHTLPRQLSSALAESFIRATRPPLVSTPLSLISPTYGLYVFLYHFVGVIAIISCLFVDLFGFAGFSTAVVFIISYSLFLTSLISYFLKWRKRRR